MTLLCRFACFLTARYRILLSLSEECHFEKTYYVAGSFLFFCTKRAFIFLETYAGGNLEITETCMKNRTV